MNAATRLLTLVALVITFASCNRRESPFTVPWQPSDLPGPGRPAVLSVTLLPSQVLAGSAAWGTVHLMHTAPAGGVQVSLSTSDPALVSPPPTVTVPGGSDQAEFVFITHDSSGDRNVGLSAASPYGLPATAVVRLQATVENAFSVTTALGYTMRLVAPDAAVTGSCLNDRPNSGEVVSVGFNAGWQSLHAEFAAAKGMSLGVGTYEGATRFPSTSGPGLDVSINSTGCNQVTGRFMVRAIDCSPSGEVRLFWATYEYHCEGAPASYGDVRVTNARKSGR